MQQRRGQRDGHANDRPQDVDRGFEEINAGHTSLRAAKKLASTTEVRLPPSRSRFGEPDSARELLSDLSESERGLRPHLRVAVLQRGDERIDGAAVADLAEGERG